MRRIQRPRAALPLAIVVVVALIVGTTGTASGEPADSSGGKASAEPKASAAQSKRGPRGKRGKRGKRGPAGPAGPAGPPGPGAGTVPSVPLLFRAPVNTANTVLLQASNLRVEAACLPGGGGTTSLTGRSLADNAVIRASGVASNVTANSNDFDANATVDLLPGGATENFLLTYLSAAGGVVTANYSTVNKGGGSQLGDCVIYGTFTLG